MKYRSRRMRLWKVVVLGVFMLAAALALGIYRSELTTRAQMTGLRNVDDFQWEGSSCLLSLTYGAQRTPTVAHYVLASHKVRVDSLLSRLFSKFSTGFDDVEVTPDGKFLQCKTNSGAFVASIDGLWSKIITDKPFIEYKWAGDVFNLLKFESDPLADRVVRIGQASLNKLVIREDKKFRAFPPDGYRVMQVCRDNIVIAEDWIGRPEAHFPREEDRGVRLMTQRALRAKAQGTRLWWSRLDGSSPNRTMVTFPSKTMVCEIAYCKTGDRIAWMIQHQTTSAFASVLKFLHIGVGLMRTYTDCILVSRLDGSQMRSQGEISYATPSRSVTRISKLRWSPDGRQLAFELDHRIYLLPVSL